MKKFYLFILITFFYLSLSAQSYYDKTYNIGYNDQPVAFVADSAENIFVCGWFTDEGSEKTRAFAMKVNSNGEELWRITLEDTSRFYALCITSTGDIALAGSKNRRSYLSKVSGQSGEKIWAWEDTASMDNTLDYWFASVNEVLDSGVYKLYTMKCKDGPNYRWSYLFDPQTGSYLIDYLKTNITTGPFYTSNSILPDLVWTAGDGYPNGISIGIVNMDNFGESFGGMNVIWDFSAEHVSGVEKYSENEGCVVRYFEWNPGEFFMAVLVMTLDDSFDVYGNAFDILDENFTVTGSGMLGESKILVTGTIDNQLSLWMINHNLWEMKENTIPTDKPRSGVDVVGLPSMNMVLMGTEQEENGGNDVFLMKLNSDGIVSTPETEAVNDFTIYPIPAKDRLWIETAETGMQYAKIRIVNLMGRVVKTATGIESAISISDLPQGLYVLSVEKDNKVVFRQKFVKE